MAYKPNYNEDYLSTLADYVTKQDDDGSDEMTGLASSFASQTASNVFTGTLTYGANIMKDYYKDYSQQMNFKDAFTSTVDMYVEQASLAKQNAESIVQKAWEEQRIANELAAEQAKGTLKEQYTLGTGQMAIGKSQIESVAKRQSIEIDLTASETLLEAWSNIDEQAASLITMTAQDYQKFIATANNIESEMWQLFLNKFGSNYAGVLGEEIDGVFTPKYTDYSTQWYTALEDIGIIDRVTGTYTDFGKTMISYIVDNPEDIIGFKEFIKTSDLGDFYMSNSKFIREQLFDLPALDIGSYYESYYENKEKTIKESGYHIDKFENMDEEQTTKVKKEALAKADSLLSGEWNTNFLKNTSNTDYVKTANELSLSSEYRKALTTGSISEGTILKIDNKSWLYIGDGVFVKANAEASANHILRGGATKAGDAADYVNIGTNLYGHDLDYYLTSVKKTNKYKYVYYNEKKSQSGYYFSNVYLGEIGSEVEGYKRVK